MSTPGPFETDHFYGSLYDEEMQTSPCPSDSKSSTQTHTRTPLEISHDFSITTVYLPIHGSTLISFSAIGFSFNSKIDPVQFEKDVRKHAQEKEEIAENEAQKKKIKLI